MSTAHTSACWLCTQIRLLTCEPVSRTSEKNRPSICRDAATGASWWRRVFMPLCESELLMAKRKPCKSSRLATGASVRTTTTLQ